MDYSKKTKAELIEICKEKGLKGYSGKKKEELLTFVTSTGPKEKKVTKKNVSKEKEKDSNKFYRLNYIGSKYQLLEWLSQQFLEKTGWESFEKKRIADLFSGTGIVSYYFRTQKAIVFSNDAEKYSSIITYAFTKSCYTDSCKKFVETIQNNLTEKKYKSTVGFITKNYSPHGPDKRMFFTIENAQAIDYIREQLEDQRKSFSDEEYNFLLASLITSADAVSNVPAVYGCFLKKFKAKATKSFVYKPIHMITQKPHLLSKTTNSDICDKELLKSIKADLVYLDPPYNNRQYSKNYFPLNMIAITPEEQELEKPLKKKTGIPESCFLSPFCKTEETVSKAFDTVIQNLKTDWIFISYNSESIVSKQKMIELLNKYGEVSVVERNYKRFKSFKYNKDKEIQEYLFCLKKRHE